MEVNNFVTREVPVHRLNEGQYAMDYDMPELVVFLHEDPHHINDICIERGDSTKGTMETSNGWSQFASQHLFIMDMMKKYGFKTLMMEGELELDSGDNNSTDHPAEKTTPEALGEIFKKEAGFSSSFKNWQINSFLGTIGSRVEFPHRAECQSFPEAKSVSRPKMGNSQCLTGSHKWSDRQADYPGETSCAAHPRSGPTSYAVLSTTSNGDSDQSNDSTSSTDSFTFPILRSEWKGSPMKMMEADRGQSRKHQWRKICFPCCKF